MTAPLLVAGRLSAADAKRLREKSRGTAVGPTTIYYAGVSAPVVSAGVALLVRQNLAGSGLSDNGMGLVSAVVAAMAGLSWYLIFMRWSDSRADTHDAKTTAETRIEVADGGLRVVRGAIETHVGWSAVRDVQRTRRALFIGVEDARSIIIPMDWFDTDGDAAAFETALRARAG